MRKVFNSRLKNAGCNSDMVEYFMGHTLGSTKGAYYTPDVEKLKEMYIQFVPHLLVSPEFELKETLKKQEAEQSELLKKMDEYEKNLDISSKWQETYNRIQENRIAAMAEEIKILERKIGEAD